MQQASRQRVQDSQLQEWFRAVDSDNSGEIDVRELQQALSRGNLNFGLSICAQMIRLHDADNSRSINFREFCALHRFITNIQEAFYRFDEDESNTLTQGEVYQALTHAGFRLPRPAFDQLFTTFDPDNNQQLELTEYMAMSVFMKSCELTFHAFDQQRRGKVELDFAQFVYAAANTR